MTVAAPFALRAGAQLGFVPPPTNPEALFEEARRRARRRRARNAAALLAAALVGIGASIGLVGGGGTNALPGAASASIVGAPVAAGTRLPAPIVFSVNNRIWLAERDGGVRPLTSDPRPWSALAWLRSGRGVLAWLRTDGTSRQRSSTGLALVGLDGKVGPVIAAGRLASAALSPDGRLLAFQRMHWGEETGLNLYVVPVRGGAARIVASNGRSPHGGPTTFSWSPDGRSLLYSGAGTRGRGLYVVAVAGGGVPRRVLSGDAIPAPENASFSPDGSLIVFQSWSPRAGTGFSEPAVYVMRSDGTAVRRLATHAFFPSWSPDGHRIAFDPRADGAGRARRPGDGGHRPRRRERAPAFHDGQPRPRRARVRPLAQLVGRWAMAHTHRWARQYGHGRPGQRHRIACGRVGAPDPVRLGLGTDVATPPVAMSNLLRRGRSIPIRSAIAGLVTVAVIAVAAAHASGARVGAVGSSGGEWIAYQRTGAVRLVRPDGSGDHILTTTPSGDQQHPDWSPDGKRIAMDVDFAGIWVVDTDGKHPRQVVSCRRPCYFVQDGAWSPDGKTIAYVRADLDASGSRTARSRIPRLDVASGATRTLANFTNGTDAAFTPRWSPDGRRLVFELDRFVDAKAATTTITGSRIGTVRRGRYRRPPLPDIVRSDRGGARLEPPAKHHRLPGRHPRNPRLPERSRESVHDQRQRHRQTTVDPLQTAQSTGRATNLDARREPGHLHLRPRIRLRPPRRRLHPRGRQQPRSPAAGLTNPDPPAATTISVDPGGFVGVPPLE